MTSAVAFFSIQQQGAESDAIRRAQCTAGGGVHPAYGGPDPAAVYGEIAA